MRRIVAVWAALALLLCALPALADNGTADVVMEGTTYHLTLDSVEVVDGQLNVVLEGFGETLRWGANGPMLAGKPEAHYGDEVVYFTTCNVNVGGPFTFGFERDTLPDEIWVNSYDTDVDPVRIWSADGAEEEADAAPAPPEAAAATGEADVSMNGNAYHLTLDSLEVVDGRVKLVIGGLAESLGLGPEGLQLAATPLLYYGDETLSPTDRDTLVGNVVTCYFDRDTLPDRIMLVPAESDQAPILFWEKAAGDAPVPAELVGSWQGTGTPGNGGPSIDLSAIIRADGTGEYTFVQSGYTESYPFAIESTDQTFRVDIPADNTLGIDGCSGTWALSEGELELQITTTFASGGDYSYSARLHRAEETGEEEAGEDEEESQAASASPISPAPVRVPTVPQVNVPTVPHVNVPTVPPVSVPTVPAISVAPVRVPPVQAPALAGANTGTAGQEEAEAAPWQDRPWQLDTLAFLTPQENDTFSIDASMSLDGSGTYGSLLTLLGSGEMDSDLTLNDLIEAVPQLPFLAEELDLSLYETYTAEGSEILLAPGDVPMTLEYDTEADRLSLTYTCTVQILSQTTENGLTTRGGTVEMQITMGFHPADEAEAAEEPEADEGEAAPGEGFADLAAGDRLTFGRYEQDSDAGNGEEPIEWMVLDVVDGKALLLSVYGLDAQPWDRDNDNTTWESCSLRRWLNDDFLHLAFSEEEQARLEWADLPASKDPEYDNPVGEDTVDRVFLLGYDEAMKYFESNRDRIAHPTQFATDGGAWEGRGAAGTCWWWLRSTGEYFRSAACVGGDGGVGSSGGGLLSQNGAVRPAVWLCLTGTAATPEPTAEPTPGPTEEPTPEPTEGPTSTPTAEPTPTPTPLPEDIAALNALHVKADDTSGRDIEGAACTGDIIVAVYKSSTEDALPEVLTTDSDDEYAFPREYRAESYETARWAAILYPHHTVIGYYGVGYGPARRTTTYLTLFDLQTQSQYDLKVATEEPPRTISVPTINGIPQNIGGASGEYHLDEAVDKLTEVVEAARLRPTEEPTPEPTPQPTEEPTPEPTEEPTPEPTERPAAGGEVSVEDVLDALDEDVYRSTYAALAEGEVIENGSKGDAARGLQQTLIAMGQNISADGSVGPKTLAALNAVQAEFGLDQSESLDAAGYESLLTRLLVIRDPDAAEALLSGQMDEGEYEYTRACAMAAQGRYATAQELFEESQWGNWEERAAACVQQWPKNGQLYKNPEVKGSSTQLTVKFNTDPDTAMLVKIYTLNDVLARTLFIGGTGQATTSLPAGTYIIKDGTGKNWYGEVESFGPQGSYEIMTFNDGAQEVELKKNYTSTITVNVQEQNDDADSVGSDWESWGEF